MELENKKNFLTLVCGNTHTHVFYFLYLLSSFSIEMGVVVDDPVVISNVHQVILTEPIVDIVVHNLYQKQNMSKTTSPKYKSG